MSDQASQEYLERRMRDCLDKASRATDPAIARVHRDFAARYAQALEEGQPPVIQFSAEG